MKCSNCKCNRNVEDFALLKNGRPKKTCNMCSKVKKEVDNEETQKCVSCKCFRVVSGFKIWGDGTLHKTCINCIERKKKKMSAFYIVMLLMIVYI